MCFDFFEQERFDAFEFIVLIPLSTCSMLFMISAYDLIAMYLAIELQSLCFYVIAASKRKSEFSTEAGLKYLILGAFSSGILLFGYDRTTTDIYEYLFLVYICEIDISIYIVNYRIGYDLDVKLADLIGCDIDLTGGTKSKNI